MAGDSGLSPLRMEAAEALTQPEQLKPNVFAMKARGQHAQTAFRVKWGLAGVLLLMVALFWPTLDPLLRTLAGELYSGTAALGSGLNSSLNILRIQAGNAVAAPLLLGMMAVTAPCQLSSGAAALAYVMRSPGSGTALPRASAFLLARVLMYSVLGFIAAVFFQGRVEAPGEGLLLIRRLMGPLMLLGGLVLLGWFRPSLPLGMFASRGLGRWVRLRFHSAEGHTGGAFLLGLAFSLSFCPTLFFLFFGITVPLSLTAPLGFSYPALFALGMTFPLLVLSTVALTQTPQQQAALTRSTVKLNRLFTPLAGVIFLLAGLFDTFVYWFM